MGTGGHLFLGSDRGPGQTQLTDRLLEVMNPEVGVVLLRGVEGSMPHDLLHVHSAGQQYPMLESPTALFEAMTEAIKDVADDLCSEDNTARTCGQIRMLGMCSSLASCLDGLMAGLRRDLEASAVVHELTEVEDCDLG